MEKSAYSEVNRQIQRFFDGYAHRWDECMCPEHSERLDAILDGLEIETGARVLDAGTGNGVLLPLLAKRGARPVAFDLSLKMLSVTQGLYPALEAGLVQADAMDLPFVTGSFDWVICNSCFPHFEDQQRAVSEFSRVLAPGGRFVVCHTDSRENINAHHRKVGRVVGGHEIPGAAVIQDYLRAAGLECLRLEDDPARYVLEARRS